MEKKYEIIKNNIDDYELKYKDKTIQFKSTVGIVEKMQNVNKNARIKMIMDLNKEGISYKDLTKEQKKDGKTYYDNSNKDELEKIYIEQETAQVFQDAIKEMLGLTLLDVIQEIGLETEDEIKDFSTDLGKVMLGNFPSRN